ncbi:hypothetical protein A2Z33_05000 [Candidatus Gottesmanbacteria bacterium RBG_16_52_11]|uniref:Uncharacterized protein n=1 Tax=Candidatus Gottesmanbacteria bacterium RBG_16_52_11 TaxID=1798374 RepID=A0A1F5YR71_9BACT|nr:MAG: hypothetical protein A2Z33_05000 [Candidatus Gottesmanbacteria bacterium RBG_16_52_11]
MKRNRKDPLIPDTPNEADTAVVTSAAPLDGRLKSLVSSVVSRIGTVRSIEYRVDPEVLGGIRIRIGNRVLDTSLKRQLSEIVKSLKSD